MVSVIIPVYNVESYLDRCLMSVVNQTYPDLEILIMEGKSTDNSLLCAIEWSKKDDRITIVSRKDGGLGPARNYGVEISRGEYILFVDSDDWIARDFVEKTLEVIQRDERIDMVTTDPVFYYGNQRQGRPEPSGPDRFYETLEEKQLLLCYGNNSMWGKLFRKTLFTQNRIIQPALPCEDLAVYPALVAASGKIAHCYRTHTFYRARREGCLSSAGTQYRRFPEIMNWAEAALKQVRLYHTYERGFHYSMYLHFRSTCLICMGEEKFRNLEHESKALHDFAVEKFSDLINVTYWAFGGFSLRWIAHRLITGKEGLKKHFAFTGIISQMSGKRGKPPVTNDSSMRNSWIESDWKGELSDYERNDLVQKPDLFLIDFLQECSDVLSTEDGHYITDSEALAESYGYDQIPARKICWQSGEYWDLWKKSCKKFIKILLESFPETRIILVKNRFAQKYLEHGKFKEYEENISCQNNLLENMYHYFEVHCPGVHIYDLPEELCYTAMGKQPYAPQPQYLNEKVYKHMSAIIGIREFVME